MKKLFVAILSLVFLCSCKVGDNRQIQVSGGATPVHPFKINMEDGHSPTALNTVRILDDSLMSISADGEKSVRKIYIERTGIRPTATNTKEVWASIRNETDHQLVIEGRVSWFDQHQAPPEGPSPWKRVFLAPNTVGIYKESSTRTDVHYYMIDIREAR